MRESLTAKFQQAARDIDAVLVEGEIRPGDLYLAGRNTGPHLLTCKEVWEGAVYPVEHAYPYDVCECVKVEDRPQHGEERGGDERGKR